MAEDVGDSQPAAVRRDVALDLAQALDLGQFFLVYQPTIDLQTNAFAGVEALIRWRHPERGVLGPDAFIDDLEASRQIVPVGRWALSTACAQGAAWHDRGYRFAVSVNISKRQFDSKASARTSRARSAQAASILPCWSSSSPRPP